MSVKTQVDLHVHYLEYVILCCISYWNSSPGKSPFSSDDSSRIYSKYNTFLSGKAPAV